MHLEIGCGISGIKVGFNYLAYDIGLGFAPRHEYDLLGAEHSGHAKGQGELRSVLEGTVEVLGLALAGAV